MKRILMVLLLAGCDKPPAPEPVRAPEPVVTKVEQPAPAPEPARVEAPKKKIRVTEESCQELNAPFIQCGYRCTRSGRGVGQCIGVCKHQLNKEYGRRCLENFGPGFM